MPDKILTYLVDKGFLNKDQLKDIDEDSLGSVSQLESELVKRNLISPIEFLNAKSAVFAVPFLDLAGKKIESSVLQEISEDAVGHYKILPILRDGNDLIIGMVDPEDVEAREALKFISLKGKFNPKVYVISEMDFVTVYAQYRNLGKEVTSALEQLEEELESEIEGGELTTSEKIEQLAAEAPITKVVAVLLRHAVEGRASDIHIEPMEENTRIRFRQDGTLYSSIILPKSIHNAIISRVKVLSNLKIDESRVPQDGRFHTKVGNKKIDFRVSSLPTSFGEKIALRILDATTGIGNFSDIGFIGHTSEVYQNAIKSPYGMVLITGPTGSGKSTTIYTTLKYLNKDSVNIITLEDPVEYFMSGINQSQVRPEIGYSFASGLRSILRQDPNIIMVGEIRDKETAGLATHAALTGHLVFSTLHTNNALGIIPRLIDMGIDQFLIPSTLVAGVAQRLVKKLCKECKNPIEIPEKFAKVVSEAISEIPAEELEKNGIKKPYKICQAPGCSACANKGTKGRLALFEIFSMTPEMEKVTLEENVSESRILEVAKKQGMISMKHDGIIKALLGLVSLEEVLRVIKEKE
jgi:type IV pilus assembly protein PilB